MAEFQLDIDVNGLFPSVVSYSLEPSSAKKVFKQQRKTKYGQLINVLFATEKNATLLC